MSKYLSITHYVFFSWGGPAAVTLSISTGIVGVWNRVAEGEERRIVYFLRFLFFCSTVERQAQSLFKMPCFHNHIIQHIFIS